MALRSIFSTPEWCGDPFKGGAYFHSSLVLILEVTVDWLLMNSLSEFMTP